MTTINITYDNIWAYVDAGGDPIIDALLYEELKYHPAGYKYAYNYKSKKWSGFNYIYDLKQHRFRRGLLSRVEKLLTDEGFQVDKHPNIGPCSTYEYNYIFDGVKTFEFQDKAVQITKNKDVGLIVSPTSTGKSTIISQIIYGHNLKTVILVTDIVLMDQMQQSLQERFKEPIGLIGDGEFDLQNITVSTIQSLNSIFKAKSVVNADKRLALIKHFDDLGMVISDEAHLFGSESVAEVMQHFTLAYKFYGLSATPYGYGEVAEKKSDLELEQHFGQVIYDARKNDFITLGLKAPLLVEARMIEPINKEYKKHTKKGRFGKVEIDTSKNYREAFETEIVNNPDFHQMVARDTLERTKLGQSVFVYASHSIEYGENLAKCIPGSVLINGSTPRIKRRQIYDAMRKKEQLVLVSDLGGCIEAKAKVFTTETGLISIKSTFEYFQSKYGSRYDQLQDANYIDIPKDTVKTASYDRMSNKYTYTNINKVWKYHNKSKYVNVSSNVGTKFCTSTTHPFLINKNNNIVDVEAQNLVCGDRLLRPDVALASDWPFANINKNTDVAWLLGMFAGDGSIGISKFKMKDSRYRSGYREWSQIRTRICNMDKNVINSAKSRLEIAANVKARIEHDARNGLMIVTNVSRRCGEWMLNSMEMDKPGRKMYTVDIPQWIIKSDVENIYAFIAGLIDSDGQIIKTGVGVAVTICSANMATTLASVLNLLGFRTHTRVRHPSGNRSTVYEISVVGYEACQLVYKTIGKYLISHKKQTLHDQLSKMSGKPPTNLKRPEVKSIEVVDGAVELYDFTCETHNNYLAGEFGLSVIHNTGLNIPSLDCFILASDVRDIRQMKGRVERASPGKSMGTFIDYNINCMFLKKHAEIRRTQYKHDDNLVIER